MPFEQMQADEWKRSLRRTLLIGPPNSWKTTSMRTWPRPIHALSFPGEHGASAIPQEEGITPYIWTEPTQPTSATAIVNEIIRTSMGIIAGKHGPCKVFWGDGLHKLYGVIYESELEGLKAAFPSMDEDKLGGRAYALAHQTFTRYLRKINSSAVEYVVFTAWSGRDKDDPDDKRNDAPRHLWPDLPGEMARRATGEFGTVFFAEPGLPIAPGKFTAGKWQTRPAGKVFGASMKLPQEIAAKIPTTVPQDWLAFEALVSQIEQSNQTTKQAA